MLCGDEAADLEVSATDTYVERAWIGNEIVRKGTEDSGVKHRDTQPVDLTRFDFDQLIFVGYARQFRWCEMVEALEQTECVWTALIRPVQAVCQGWISLAYHIKKCRLYMRARAERDHAGFFGVQA